MLYLLLIDNIAIFPEDQRTITAKVDHDGLIRHEMHRCVQLGSDLTNQVNQLCARQRLTKEVILVFLLPQLQDVVRCRQGMLRDKTPPIVLHGLGPEEVSIHTEAIVLDFNHSLR